MKNLIENKDLIVISCDKDSYVVILKRSDYAKKLQSMIDNAIAHGTYAPTTDSTLSDLKKCQNFLRRSFKEKFNYYKNMRPAFN